MHTKNILKNICNLIKENSLLSLWEKKIHLFIPAFLSNVVSMIKIFCKLEHNALIKMK